MPLVLIVDDQVTNQRIFSRIAASIGDDVAVRAFGDPQAALDWLDDTIPDLIVTDYKMPHMDGAEFIRRVREREVLADIPIIVITVFEERRFRLKALDAGATDFLQSPVDHQEFITRARNLLKLRKQQLLLANRADRLERELKVSERSLEQAIRDSTERLAQVIDTVPAMISATDRGGRFLFMNAYTSKLTGTDPAAVVGRDAVDVFGADTGARGKALDRLVFDSGKPLHSFEEDLVDQAGTKRVFLTTKSPLKDALDGVAGVLTSSLDITDRKLAESHLFQMAHYDALTGLPNRTLLHERLQREIARARRGDRHFALHLIDLDRFKGVNDVLGHSIGDKFLKSVAQRLRMIEDESHLVARLGGDEFAILQGDIAAEDQAAAFATHVGTLIGKPYVVSGETIATTASIGITMHPADGGDFEELLRNADLAMYRAKAEGGNQHRFYASDMNIRARQAAVLDAELRQAIEDKQFLLYYQPQVRLSTGRIVGAEALLRWRQSDGEITGPASFLPRAEENGLIVPINEWVLREACRQIVAWQRAGLPRIRIGVNFSPVQLRKQSVPLLVARVLADTGLDPRLLDIEITESLFLNDMESVAVQLRQLRELGVSISIDDFGTGYSSLSYIKHFPIDRLKIDQSFVRGLVTEPSDAAIVRAIISLGHSLDLEVVAEGVETADQLARLRTEECDEVQGFYFGRPVAAADFVNLLRSDRGLARSA